MKSWILLGLFATVPLAHAEDDHHPCKKIKEACESAGFKKGEHKDKKGLWKDCIQPIMKGESVAGVSANAADISACKAKREDREEKHHK